MNKSITFITGNMNKLKEVKYYLDHPIKHIELDLTEIQSLDTKKIVEHKVKEAYAKVHEPVIVEDVSLTFTALGKLPGPLIKWFLEALKKEGLCRILDNYADRSAVASVIFGFYDGKNLELFEGATKGEIATNPRGDNGFGWTPIFIPKGYVQTWGEMTVEEQKVTSMRRIAVEKLAKYLKSL